MSQDESAKQPGVPAQPAEEADLKERTENFRKDLVSLLGKYELVLGAQPKILADGTLAADPVVGSARSIKKQNGSDKSTDLADPSK